MPQPLPVKGGDSLSWVGKAGVRHRRVYSGGWVEGWKCWLSAPFYIQAGLRLRPQPPSARFTGIPPSPATFRAPDTLFQLALEAAFNFIYHLLNVMGEEKPCPLSDDSASHSGGPSGEDCSHF